ncbi:MAG: pyrrolo-quinoline quinone [Acidobacteriia bacterium]|nr:pyrrolo-quinoline quinone [Terriglobia bacterium]
MKLLAASALTFLLVLPPVGAQVNVTTSRNNNSRDGQNLNETILTPANVNVGHFGKLFSQPVDGYIYAQPLYVSNVSLPGLGVHNVAYVATEHDSVYAFDADNNTGMNASPLWHTSFIDPAHGITSVSSGDVSCNDLVPEIGVSGTAAIDLGTQTMYVLAKTKENGQFFHRLHALDITTGQERPGSPVVISARVKGNGDGSSGGYINFDPLREAHRAGLLLVNGFVFIAWASHCDIGPYHGWVMVYNQTTLKRLKVWNTTPNGGLGGVWQSGTGLASDGNYVFFATGNGTYDGPKGGRDFGDSVAKVPAVLNPPRPYDYFTPYNQGSYEHFDTDVGSGGVLLLPDQGDGAPHRHLLVQVGKSGSIYLIDRDRMGAYNPNNNSQIVQDMEGAVGGLWATPAWWNNNVYFGGSGDYLRQYTFDPTTGLLSNGAITTSRNVFGYPGSSPSISANGTSDAIVWALQTDNYGRGPGILHAYDANNLATELYNSNQNQSRDNPGGAVKFTVPTIANGKVYVPASQQLSVFGLLAN